MMTGLLYNSSSWNRQQASMLESKLFLWRRVWVVLIYGVVNSLLSFILCFKDFLHVEVKLALALYTLLFHVSNDALVHSLRYC